MCMKGHVRVRTCACKDLCMKGHVRVRTCACIGDILGHIRDILGTY